MKALGLLVVLFGASLAYLIGWRCYRVQDFQQELANFLNLPVGQAKPGVKVNPPDCPKFGLPSIASGG